MRIYEKHMNANHLILGLLLIGFMAWGSSCSESAQEAPPSSPTSSSTDQKTMPASPLVQVPPEARHRVKVEMVKERLVPQTITAPGEVSLDLTRVAHVSSRIEGQADQVFGKLGDRVTKGQALVAIGSMKLDELVQNYLVTKVQKDVSRANFLRTKKLVAEQVVSQRRFLEDRAKYLETKTIHQHVTEKLINMGLTKAELQELVHGTHTEGHRYLLKAPLSGIIASQTVVLGQGVMPGHALFQLVDTSRVWIFANVPVEQVGMFHPGDQALIVPKGRPSLQAALSYIAPVADKATLTVRFRFDVENPQEVLKPNEYVEVRLKETSISILAIPESAPTFVEGTQGVFVKRTGGYAFVPVELGRKMDHWIEVKKGLRTGEEVAIKGVFDLKNALLKNTLQGA